MPCVHGTARSSATHYSPCSPLRLRSYAITINVAQVARPPVIFPQNRSIAEDAVPGTLLLPALVASQPQGLSLNFSVSPATVFGILSSGVLYLQVRETHTDAPRCCENAPSSLGHCSLARR